MATSIEKVESTDVYSIYKLLKYSNALVTTTLMEDILEHIDKNIALKLVENGELIGVWMSKEEEEYTGLSFFYIAPKHRYTKRTFRLFGVGAKLINQSKPLVWVAKDTTGFAKYVDKIGENLYAFKGFK